MKRLGLNPTRNSGAGWLEKADGQDEDVISELKSTEKASISVRWADLHKLEEQAIVAGKLPVFAIEDLTNDELYVILKPEDIQATAKYLKTGKYDSSAYIAREAPHRLDSDTVSRAPKKIIGAPSRELSEGLRYHKREEKAY